QGWIHGSSERDDCACAKRELHCRRSISGRTEAKCYGNQAVVRLSHLHMQLPRFIGIVDIGLIAIVIVAVALPPRSMDADPAVKGNDAQQFALAVAEARTIARPDDGVASAELARQLADGGFNDWSIDVAMAGAERANPGDAKWRPLLTASVGFVDRKEP